MEEAKRFMRYVLPGLTFFLEVIVAIYIEDGIEKAQTFLKLDLAITAFLVSGALGYIFSNLYYCYFWKISFSARTKLNYKKVIEKNIKIFEKSFGPIDINTLKQRDAFIKLNAYWQINKAEDYGVIENQVGNLNNILHSLGTSIILIIIGFIFGIFYLFHNCSLVYFIIVNLFIIFFLLANYRQVRELLQSLYVSLFEIAFRNKKHNH